MKISRVLIANRGEIAVRIIRTCQRLGIETVLAASQCDKDSLPARMADRTVCIGPSRASESYLNEVALITAALGTESDALHPGYGFLAESSSLAHACSVHGIRFIGPKPHQIQRMGNKLEARRIASECGVPTVPGSEKVYSWQQVQEVANRIGLPLILKAAAGGGGRGMKLVNESSEIPRMYMSATAEALAGFGDGTIYVERFIPNARHVEVQLLGDAFGNVIHLGERDCSLQRRYQKVIEEAPAPNLPDLLRQKIRSAAVSLAQDIRYENAGTIEFIVDQDAGTFFFLEMNTRIQVEHPVTESVTGTDIVEEQIRIASGGRLRYAQSDVTFNGHAIECRINAELPHAGFRPSPGQITEWHPPEDNSVRLDTHCYAGYEVPIFYDSLLGKLIVHGLDRADAIRLMRQALSRFTVEGVGTTLSFLNFVMNHSDFAAGRVNTRLVEKLISEMAGDMTR